LLLLLLLFTANEFVPQDYRKPKQAIKARREKIEEEEDQGRLGRTV
jgi:hypothetical protein